MNLEKSWALTYQHPERWNELNWLAEQASKHKLICEIGSWKGSSTRALADNTSGTVYAVDTFMGDIYTREDWEFRGNPPEWLYTEFIKNTSDLKNLVVVKMLSVDAAKELKDLRFDMIFIDAEHTYESVKSDILAWKPLLADGGLLCGHDFEPGFPGVIQAVQELLPNAKATGAGTIWAV